MAGKGDRPRPVDRFAFARNYERIFGPDKRNRDEEQTQQGGSVRNETPSGSRGSSDSAEQESQENASEPDVQSSEE